MSVVIALSLWIFYLPLFYTTGALIFKPSDDDEVIVGIIKIALGMGIIGYLVIALGSVGMLKPIPVYVALATVFLLGIKYLSSLRVWLSAVSGFLFVKPVDFLTWGLRIIFLFSLIVWALCSFTPEIANDSLAYHLYLPKVWIHKASVLPIWYDEKSYRSLFMEQLFCVPMLLGSVPAAVLFHGITGLACFVAVFRYWHKKTEHYNIALFLSVLLWLTPTIFNQIANSYTDASVAFFVFLSFYLFEKALLSDKKTRYFFSGLLMGLAVSSKLLALLVGLGLGCWGIVRMLESTGNRKKIFEGLLLFCAGVFLSGSYWFVRNAIMEGDPLYPLFTSKFGTLGLYQEQKFSAIGVPKNIISYLLLPVLTAIDPVPFNKHHWVGPLYLVLFPVIVYAGIKVKQSRGALLVAWVSLTAWFLLAQDIRFLYPAFSIGLTAGAYGLSELSKKKLNHNRILFLNAAALAGLMFYFALGVYHYRVQLQSVFERWGQTSYLRKLERSYPMAEWMNHNLPEGAKVLNAIEVRTYYFDSEMIDFYMFLRMNPDVYKMSPAQYIDKLKSLGIRYILHTRLAEARDDMQKQNKKFSSLLPVFEDTSLVKQLFSLNSENIREDRYSYTIYEIRG